MHSLLSKDESNNFVQLFLEYAMENDVYWMPTKIISLNRKIDYHQKALISGSDSPETQQRLLLFQQELSDEKQKDCLTSNFLTKIRLFKPLTRNRYSFHSPESQHGYMDVDFGAIFSNPDKPKVYATITNGDNKVYHFKDQKTLLRCNDLNNVWILISSFISKDNFVYDCSELEKRRIEIKMK